MTVKQCLSGAIVAALVSGWAPVGARAEEPAQPVDRSVTLKTSIDRAALQLASDRHQPARARTAAASEGSAMQASSGGGGGHTMMIVSLVSAAAGLGATYYMVKQMQKTTASIPTK